MIITANFGALIEMARKGKICAFRDPEEDRWFSEWKELFGLEFFPRRQAYVNAGFLIFSTASWPHLLGRWWNACEKTYKVPTVQEGGSSPISQADQDALNAILMSEYPADALYIWEQVREVFAWDFGKVKIKDERSLECEFRGRKTAILHACGRSKPWQKGNFRFNAYGRLLRRLLHANDLNLVVPTRDLPLALRPGSTGLLAHLFRYLVTCAIISKAQP